MFLSNFRFVSSIVNTEFSPELCAAPNLNADTVLQTFGRTCYEFHVTRGESYEKAQQICKSHGKYFTFVRFFFSRCSCGKY